MTFGPSHLLSEPGLPTNEIRITSVQYLTLRGNEHVHGKIPLSASSVTNRTIVKTESCMYHPFTHVQNNIFNTQAGAGRRKTE